MADWKVVSTRSKTQNGAIMKFTITCEVKDRWVPHLLGMLQTMQSLGYVGSSRIVGFFADGDGDFHPKFEVDGKPIIEQNLAKPMYDDSSRPKDAVCDYFYDAG